MTPFGVPAHRESEAPFVYKFCRFTVTGLTMARFLCPFLAFASLLPLRLSFQQFFFRYAEYLSDGIVKPFKLRFAGNMRRGQWLHAPIISCKAIAQQFALLG